MSNDNQSTPQAFYDKLHRIYQFTLDAAADHNNRKCPIWFGPGGVRDDALSDGIWPTSERIFLNPPYSRGMQLAFVNKSIECASAGGFVVALLPADTSTRLFHNILWGRYPVEFVRGRLKFNGVASPAKFGSMLVTFK